MSLSKRILFVEDEEHLQSVIGLNLKLEGYQVQTALTGEEAIRKFAASSFDLIILDVMLPEIDGYAVCEHIRLKDKIVPIMFLSARSSAEERKKGLKLGADDYLAKPFDLEEFLLRVKRLIQRNSPFGKQDLAEEYQLGIAKVNLKSFSIYDLKGQELRILSQTEMMLLQLLLSRRGEAVSRNDIIDVVWGGEEVNPRTIDNMVVQFRKDFEEDPKNPTLFKSVHGVGYRLSEAT